jgi:hypothetical protein
MLKPGKGGSQKESRPNNQGDTPGTESRSGALITWRRRAIVAQQPLDPIRSFQD